jgi:hypothetical protein
MAGYGGRRAGAGRKPNPEFQEFRAWLRREFNKPGAREKILDRAWTTGSDTVLVELLRQAFGKAPQTITLNTSDPLAVHVSTFSDGAPFGPAAPETPSEDVRGGDGS